MRVATGLALATAASVVAGSLMAAPASAQPARVDWEALSAEKDAQFKSLLPGMRDGKICFSRRYDAAHMRKHPDQQVTKLLLQIRRDHSEGDPSYRFRLSAHMRGHKETLYTYGDCNFYDGSFRCGVECDAGGFFMKRTAGTGDLSIRIHGRLTMFGCGGEIVLKPGTDDKLFRLHEADAPTCASLDSQEH